MPSPEDLPDLQPGDELSAAWLNALRDLYYASDLTFDPGSGLTAVKTRSGTSVGLIRNTGFWIKITSGTQPYAWIEQVATTGGGWSDGPRTGTTSVDPAYEVNGNATVAANTRAWASRDKASGLLLFLFSKCT